ncbi:Zinc/iron permease [Mycotypha africana]|uniref:Zinc/iron permease n=1 Tax=Mycotypha africana TaxID=64632 RepID=UPI0023015A20|nr:Zinc/iron permease [Mycotypha africana]KAI8975393.1 Zinc/iron permease [Mycotypha africana]
MPPPITNWKYAVLFLIFIHLVNGHNEALEASLSTSNTADADACAAEFNQDYNMPMRVGALFIVFATSSIGVFTPIILHKLSPYSKGSGRDWVLTIGKFFGTGVILATAFVHMLPEALESFHSPCLSEGWKSYGAFGGVFCMFSSFALQLLELAAIANIDRIRAKKAANNKAAADDIEKAITTQQSSVSLESDSTDATANNSPTATKCNVFDQARGVEESGAGHHHLHHDHIHSAGLFEDEESFKHIGTLILELGIVMHSIIIGITLSNAGSDEFITLLIALVFHQFFEGIALGTRINDMNMEGWKRPTLMGLLYMVMTPFGCAIGIGIHSSFNPNSSSAILSSAILDSLSAGILLYNAYVSLMSQEMNQNPDFRRAPAARKLVCFLSMYCGAALMALIGKWA